MRIYNTKSCKVERAVFEFLSTLTTLSLIIFVRLKWDVLFKNYAPFGICLEFLKTSL